MATTSKFSARLNAVPLDAVYSNMNGRTAQTAQLIIGDLEIPLILQENFHEINVGEWQGMFSVDMERNYPKQVKAYYKRPSQFESASGENCRMLKGRVVRAVKEISAALLIGYVLLVNHGVVKKCLMNYFSGAHFDLL